MKKIIIAIVVTVLLMLPANVLAEPTTSKGSTLSFDNLEELISEYNPAVKISDRLLEILDQQYDLAEDLIDDQISAAQTALTAQIAQYDSQIASYASLIDYYTNINPDPVKADTYTTAKNNLEAVKTLLQAQLNNVDDSEDDSEEELEEDFDLDKRQTRCQITLSRDTQVYLAQKSYLGYLTLSSKLQEAKDQLDLLNKNQDIMKLKVSLGMATQADLENFQVSLESAKLAVDGLEREISNAEGTLNLALGHDFNKQLTIEPLPALDWEKIHNINYEKDLESALAANYKLELLNVNSLKKGNEAERADEDSGEEKIAEIARENLEIQIEDMKRKIESAFDQAHKNLLAKEDAYEVALGNYQLSTTNWNFTKLKYDLGMISSLDYSDAQNKYEVVQHQYQNAQQAVLEAYTDYQWAVAGLIPSLNS